MNKLMKNSSIGSQIIHVHGLTILANLLISTSFTVGHTIAYAFEPGVLMLIRFAMAALIMGIFPLMERRFQLMLVDQQIVKNLVKKQHYLNPTQ